MSEVGNLQPPPNPLEQLQLAVSIISNRHSLFLSEHEEWLLGLQPDYSSEDIKIAAEEILIEIVGRTLPQPEIFDPRRVAVELLRTIKAAGGILRPDRVHLPFELMLELQKQNIIRVGDNGVVWGKYAANVIRDFGDELSEAEPERGEP